MQGRRNNRKERQNGRQVSAGYLGRGGLELNWVAPVHEMVTWLLEEGAQMTERDMHGACPGYMEVEDERAANKNHEGADDVLDRIDYG